MKYLQAFLLGLITYVLLLFININLPQLFGPDFKTGSCEFSAICMVGGLIVACTYLILQELKEKK